MYQANYYVKNYLIGKGFSYVSSDYRYYYFTESSPLTLAISQMPYWYRDKFAPAWDG